MLNQQARPAFASKKMQPSYYSEVLAFAQSLQPTRTLRQISEMLNQAGSRSPTGMLWDRQKLANILRSKSV